MPVLSNSRHEKFAQAVAKGSAQSRAYVDAGYKPDDGAASRLSRNVKVRARIDELLGNAADGVVADLVAVQNRLSKLGLATIVDDNLTYAVQVKALTELGKMLGGYAPPPPQQHLHAHINTDGSGDLNALARKIVFLLSSAPATKQVAGVVETIPAQAGSSVAVGACPTPKVAGV